MRLHRKNERYPDQQNLPKGYLSREASDDHIKESYASRAGVYGFAALMFVVGFGVVFACTLPIMSAPTVILSMGVGFLLASTIRVAPQWERVPILRMGKFSRVAGPGVYAVIPLIDSTAMHVDQRMMTSAFYAEEALTADLVSVDVDAILFWVVWDSKKACLEVANYPQAVLRSAQTAVRDAVGQVNLAELSMRRRQLDHELQEFMSEKCEAWGISILSVEIRDIKVPDELQDALSREAQAERERDARVLLAEVEKDISEMYVEAARVYNTEEGAMQLRAMNLAYEGARDGKGVLLAPSSLADGFVDLARKSL